MPKHEPELLQAKTREAAERFEREAGEFIDTLAEAARSAERTHRSAVELGKRLKRFEAELRKVAGDEFPSA